MKTKGLTLVAAAALALGQGSAAAEDIRKERVNFKPGARATQAADDNF